MNIQQLRQSLKMHWLSYYEQNRTWLVKMRVWGTYNGLRRPLSGFILATLSVLEPQFDEIVSFIVELNNNPDEIVAALGLNFNPEQELNLIKSQQSLTTKEVEKETPQEQSSKVKVISAVAVVNDVSVPSPAKTSYAEHLPADLPRNSQPVQSLTAEKPEKAIALATKIVSHSPVQPVRSLAITSSSSSKGKPVISLALANEVNHHPKPVRSFLITTDLPSQAKTLPSLALTEKSGNGEYVSLPKNSPKQLNISPNTNARSLASWVDEFCQGSELNRDEAILM